MSDATDRVAQHLRAQRDKIDSVSRARLEQTPDPLKVLEVLERLRATLLDLTTTQQLESDLEVVHGLVAARVGVNTAARLVEQLPVIRHCLAMDVQAAFDGDPAAKSYSEIVFSYPSALAVSTYRIAHAFYELGEPVVARVMSEEAHSRTGIDIHPGAEIGCHFFIDHGTGVVVGETTVIGNRVKLYHGVTLGAFSNREGRLAAGMKRHPTIEDDVTIYPNATILGGDTVIGARAVIGGNVWITSSVPPDTRVVIEPPRLRIRTDDDEAEVRPGRDC